MDWTAIIAMLLPIILPLIQKLIDSLLNRKKQKAAAKPLTAAQQAQIKKLRDLLGKLDEELDDL